MSENEGVHGDPILFDNVPNTIAIRRDGAEAEEP